MQINKIAVNNHGIGLDDVRREVESTRSIRDWEKRTRCGFVFWRKR